jgi:hypothetical protein
MQVELRPRSDRVDEVIRACAEKRISFKAACQRIAEMGYRTTSVYEMVREAEAKLQRSL